MRLGGWKRLWIVLSVLYLLLVAFITITDIPKKSHVKRDWASATIDIVKQYDENLKHKFTWRILDEYTDMSYEELIEQIRKKYSDKFRTENETSKIIDPFKDKWEQYRIKKHYVPDNEFEVVNERYKKRLSSLWKEQAKSIGLGLVLWGVPVTAVFVLGVAFGWIYRGFKTDYLKR